MLENQLRENADAIFGRGAELPAGHRERFEQRLKEFSSAQEGFKDKTLSDSLDAIPASNLSKKAEIIVKRKKWVIAIVAAAAVIAGFVFLLNPFAEKPQKSELALVRSYYRLLFEEQAEITRELIQQVDETHRDILYTNVKLIENTPVPEVQLTDDEHILLIADFYKNKIEKLQNLQNLIKSTPLNNN